MQKKRLKGLLAPPPKKKRLMNMPKKDERENRGSARMIDTQNEHLMYEIFL